MNQPGTTDEGSLLLTLEEISRLVAHSHDPGETLGNIVRLIQGRFHTAVCSVYFYEPARGELILGATVGAGFASFESAGYALTAVIGHADDHPVRRIMETEAFRAVLAPFGHITWTALLGGAIFAAASMPASSRGRARVVAWTLIGIVALHAAWDASYGWAIMITQGAVGDGWDLTWPNTQAWIGEPSGGTLVLFQAVYDGLLALWGAIGATWIVRRWRSVGRRAVAVGDPPTSRV